MLSGKHLIFARDSFSEDTNSIFGRLAAFFGYLLVDNYCLIDFFE